MRLRQALAALLGFSSCLFVSFGDLFAADWPQWLGPNRDGVSQETGLIKSWGGNGTFYYYQDKLGSTTHIADANGATYTYDINTNTNYNPAAESAAGIYGMRAIAAYLGSELKKLERSKFGTKAAA